MAGAVSSVAEDAPCAGVLGYTRLEQSKPKPVLPAHRYGRTMKARAESTTAEAVAGSGLAPGALAGVRP